MRPARSLLLVPGNLLEALDDEGTRAADAVILDLAATVPDSEKPRARKMAAERIAREPGQRWFLRVNPIAAAVLADDLDAAMRGTVEGIVVPQLKSAEEVRRLDRAMAAAESERGLAAGKVGLILELDSARAVFFAHELAAAAPRIVSLAFNGSEHGDLATDLGAAWSIDGPELMYARQYALVAARAADIGCPLDGYFANVEDGEGLTRDTEVSRRLGYRGRVVIDPRQIEPVNRIYSPTREEVDYHRRVLETLEAAIADGRASVTLDGKMIDYAHAETARAVLAQARELGGVP
jgi:citrate lyase subunit beta/citryl-CoA lyase